MATMRRPSRMNKMWRQTISVGQDAEMSANHWQDLVNAYLNSRNARKALAASSRDNYRVVLTGLADALAQVPLESAPVCCVEAIDVWLVTRGWAVSTITTNLGIIRPFLKWVALRGYQAGGAAQLLTNPRRQAPLPRALPAQHVTLLLQIAPDARGRAIVLLEGQCGLRRAEVAAIRMRDMDLYDGSLLVHGKGGIERRVFLSPETMEAIQQWLLERGTRPGALICPYGNRVGQHLTPTWIGMLVARWMTDAGLKTSPGDGVSGHALRHTAATQLLREGANIRVVQAAMGHSSITTTARYLRADDPEVKAAMQGLAYGSRRLRVAREA